MATIVFDLWGTLIDQGLRSSPFKVVRKMLGLRMDFGDFVQEFEEVLMTKEYKDLYEGFTAVCEHFDVEPRQDLLDKLVGMWNKNHITANMYDDTEEALTELQDHTLLLIANTDNSIEPVMERFALEQYFDQILLSYETGKLKHGMMTDLLEDHDEVVLVGDSMHSDMAIAEDLNIKGILIDRKDRREYEPKVLTLLTLRDEL